jgi:hypothetical protein
MKKLALITFAVLVFFFVSSRQLTAQNPEVRLGIVTDQSFSLSPFHWTIGVDFTFKVVGSLFLDPEIYMIIQNFDFETIKLAPGIMLNYLPFNGFWFGGGITKWEWWRLGSAIEASQSSDVALKLNASIINSSVTMTFFMITPFNNIFNEMTLGLVFRF